MSVIDWRACHGITKANYDYRLRRVREACLESLAPETPVQQIVPVNPDFLQQGLSVSVNGFSIQVTESTPLPLLAASWRWCGIQGAYYAYINNQSADADTIIQIIENIARTLKPLYAP